MSPDDRAARIEALLAQHAWVRALARTLVRDDSAADDLAQEAWLAALRSPPASAGAVRSWFGTVLRNASRQAHRSASRRERREDAAARPEAQPGSHEIVSRAEEHRRVVDAVLALDEPYRTTILLRFFDELPPREIAARTDVPVETVRARVRRAIERLRMRLDGEHGGDGSSWRLALLPLAGLGTVSAESAAAAAVAQAGAAPSAAPALTSSWTTGAIAMSGANTVAVGVVALVLGAVAGGVVASAKLGAEREADATRAAEQARVAESHAGRLAAELTAAQSEAQRAKGEAAVLDQKLKGVAAELAAEKSRAEESAAALGRAQERLQKYEGPASPSAPERQKPAFAFQEFGGALEKVDWASVAEHTTGMVGPIREIADALLTGQPVPLKAAGEAQKHNGPLIQAVGVIAGELSGTGPNGAYTHPAFQVNALAAALEKIGKPLSDTQRASMEELGRRFTEEERKRIGSYDDQTFQMKKLVEEGDLKNRFFNRVREILVAEQLDAISPAPTRDRLSVDLWSEGLLWATVTRQVRFDKKEQLTDVASRTLGAVFKLDDAQKEKVAAIVADWAGRLPQALVERKPDALEAAGMAPSDLVAEAAAETRKLIERVTTELALSGDQLAAARKWGVVFLPVPGERDE